MTDPTEKLRREMIENNQPACDLKEAEQRWDTAEVQRDFIVHSFMAPFVFVTRKADGVKGTMQFTHLPRFYFNFKPD